MLYEEMLYKYVKNFKEQGKKEIYVNILNLSLREIDALRNLIKKGILMPQLTEIIDPNYLSDYQNGKCLAPQCTYIIQ